jgi:hypothetical protein
MKSRTALALLAAGVAAALIPACSATSNKTFSGVGGSPGATGNGIGGSSGVGAGQNGGPGGGVFGSTGVTGSDSGNGCNSGPNDDADHDGWTVAQGDCNDCDPNVNPGAVDTPAHTGADGGMIPAADNDCDGKITVGVVCDTTLAVDDIAPMHGANAIELCQTTTATPATPQQKTWGVISANYVRANGVVYTPSTEVGILQNFGPNVKVQAGSSMLALSSGHARLPGQAGACGKISCSNNGTGTAPSGFPQNIPNCKPATAIADDEALELRIRAPTNATGYTFNFKFHSFEYPTWVCTNYNDQFVTLVNPAPMGSLNGNISFDANHNPVSVNLGYFEVCDPASLANFGIKCTGAGCPPKPSPYCPSGLAELQGTGFDTWGGSTVNNGGATTWLQTSAPVVGGSDFTIRFTIWDTGNNQYDSTVLVDNFQWVATGGTVTTVTVPTTT